MAGIANLFTPSTETIRGISDRTGMNLPNLPYGGIMSLLTGGPVGLAAHYAANNLIPSLTKSVNPDLEPLAGGNSMTNEYLLDKMFGKVELPDNFPYAQAMGFESLPEFYGGQYNQNAMEEPTPPAFDYNGFLEKFGLKSEFDLQTPDFPNTGIDFPSAAYEAPAYDFGNFETPSFGNFETPVYDFGDFNAPSFDFGDFDFRRGGKI